MDKERDTTCGVGVSVLMAVYNPEPGQLREAVASLLRQDYEDIEIVIVEDPGPRSGRDVIEGFKDPRVIYRINEKRTSFAGQLNLGLELCSNELVARMDADDIAEPNRISRQREFMCSNPETSVLGSDLSVIDEAGRLLGYRRYPRSAGDVARQMRLASAVAHPAVMFRKSDVTGLGGYRPQFGMVADYDLWCRMVLAGKVLRNMDEPLLRYRVHAQASKLYALRESIRMTLRIKREHFKVRKDLWAPLDALRYHLEQMLLLLPRRLVFLLFMAMTVRKAHTR